MANPSSFPIQSTEADTQLLFLQFVVGATGAVGAITDGNEFLPQVSTPIVRDSAGVYSFFLKEGWGRFRAGFAQSVGALTAAAGTVGIVTTQSATATSAFKVIITMVRTDTGVAAEVSEANQVCVTLIMRK